MIITLAGANALIELKNEAEFHEIHSITLPGTIDPLGNRDDVLGELLNAVRPGRWKEAR